MPPPPADAADRALAAPALRAALAAGLDDPPSPPARRLAEHLAGTFGAAAVALVHYGSHATGADARPGSAHDFFVVVSDYAAAYRAAAAAGAAGYRPGVAAALNRILPPNVVAAADRGAEPPLRAKCAVLSLDDLRRACSPRARDHFVRGRLFQQAQLAWARDGAARAAVRAAVVEARAGSFGWGRPSLPARFDAEGYCRALLGASFAAEVRPEGPDRVGALVAAQRAVLVPMYDALLAALAGAGVLARDGGAYRDPHPPDAAAARRRAAYFRRSKRPGDGALGQVRGALRRLARLRGAEGRAPRRRRRRAHRARAPLAVALSLAEGHSLPPLPPAAAAIAAPAPAAVLPAAPAPARPPPVTATTRLALGLAAAVLLTMPVFAVAARRRPRDADVARRPTTVLLGYWVRDWVMWLIAPLERALVRSGVSPDVFNYLGAGLGAARGRGVRPRRDRRRPGGACCSAGWPTSSTGASPGRVGSRRRAASSSTRCSTASPRRSRSPAWPSSSARGRSPPRPRHSLSARRCS
jgi:hypothetical protein